MQTAGAMSSARAQWASTACCRSLACGSPRRARGSAAQASAVPVLSGNHRCPGGASPSPRLRLDPVAPLAADLCCCIVVRWSLIRSVWIADPGDLIGVAQWRIYQGAAKEFGSVASDSSPRSDGGLVLEPGRKRVVVRCCLVELIYISGAILTPRALAHGRGRMEDLPGLLNSSGARKANADRLM